MDSQDDIAVFQAFDAYDFEHDPLFQLGLQSIEYNKEDTKVVEEAKIFYYSRRIAPIDQEKYTAWKLANSSKNVEAQTHSASFAEIVGMITRGETIPGIRQIPDELSSLTPSTSTSVAPRKPWEQQQQQNDDNTQTSK
ncbi:hypothetical protein IW146_010075 [Coemansia sp. RSA 922]|nr:hypothetical protein H4S03_007718 [Coemansia sp. S3946]KAJ2097981.1 hypothetical protein IW146_010075 [Coemansia sp. RSA 922]